MTGLSPVRRRLEEAWLAAGCLATAVLVPGLAVLYARGPEELRPVTPLATGVTLIALNAAIADVMSHAAPRFARNPVRVMLRIALIGAGGLLIGYALSM